MKYILLISMIFSVFSPKGVCASDMVCCEDTPEITFTDDVQDTEAHACCLAMHGDEDKSDNKKHSTHHDCCCLTVMTTIIHGEDLSYLSHESNQDIFDGVEKLTSRLSFSIWIPPAEVA